jgi:hypothetical protein
MELTFLHHFLAAAGLGHARMALIMETLLPASTLVRRTESPMVISTHLSSHQLVESTCGDEKQ